jgi:hypothetical protein
MNRSNIRNILFLLLVLVLVFLFRDRLPFGNKNISFAVDNQADITRIEFSDNQKDLILEKIENGWFVNGEYETRKSSISFILRVLGEIKVKSPVSPEKFKEDIIEKEITPVNVRIYGKSRLLKSFLVYKTPSNSYGNIMKLRERAKPFIVSVPGYEVNIGAAFVLNDLYWRPFTLFNLLPSEIASVKFENFSDTTSSFSVSAKNKHYSVSDLKSELSGYDSLLVKRYLTYFTWIPFETWAFDLSEDEKKSIESGSPLYRISVVDRTGKITVLTLWERELNENGDKVPDSDRLWGKTAGNDEFFIMRYFDVDPILKKRSYFFPD